MMDLVVILALPWMFAVGLKAPERLLLAWIVLMPLQHDTIFFGHDFRVVTFDRLACFASLAGLAASGRLGELIPRKFTPFEKWILAFIAIFMLEAVICFSPRDAFSTWTNTFDLFGVPLYLYLLTKCLLLRDGRYDENLERRIAYMLAIVGLYCAAMGFFEQMTKIDLIPRSERGLRVSEEDGEGGVARANGPFAAPGVLGQFLSFTLLFVIYRWRVHAIAGAAIKKLITIPTTLMMAAGLYSVMFRNIWGGFLGGWLIRSFLNPKTRKKVIWGGVAAAIIGACAFQALSNTKLYQERLSNTSNIHDRMNAWAYAFRAFSEHPLVGIGYGQLKYYIRGAQDAGDDMRYFFPDVAATYHPHNTVIGMLGENGLLLTLTFLGMIWTFVRLVKDCVKYAYTEQEIEFGCFTVGAAFIMFAPHMTDRCLQWAKYNNLLFVFFAIVAANHVKLMQRLPVESELLGLHPDDPEVLDETPSDPDPEPQSEPSRVRIRNIQQA